MNEEQKQAASLAHGLTDEQVANACRAFTLQVHLGHGTNAGIAAARRFLVAAPQAQPSLMDVRHLWDAATEAAGGDGLEAMQYFAGLVLSRYGATPQPSAQALTDALHYLRMGMENLALNNGVHMVDFRNAERALLAAEQPNITFQDRVQPWMLACFGAEIAADTEERNHRFLEEALELVQACGATASEAHQLVDYVYGRPVGDKHQEVGGVMVTLAALCLAQGLDMHAAGETELARIWTKVEQIRAKQAAKPEHSPLPQHVAEQPSEEKRDGGAA